MLAFIAVSSYYELHVLADAPIPQRICKALFIVGDKCQMLSFFLFGFLFTFKGEAVGVIEKIL